MKDFNIAKYLKENSLGSHSILGAYVDLHALKEEEVGNNKPVDEVPYVGAEEKLDGFGDEFDQVAPVEEAVSAWEEKLNYYESEINDLVYDMVDTTGADADQIADFFQYISTQIRNKSSFGSMEEEFQYDDDKDDVNPFPSIIDGDDDEDQSWMKDDRFADLGGDQIKAGIKSLVDDGFDTREIAQFVVDTIRAFKSFKEEVTVSSSGVEMEEVAKDEFSNIINTLNGIAKKVKPAGAKLSFDDDSFSDAIIVQIVTEDGDFKLQKAIHAEVKKLVQKANSGFKVSRIEQDSPGRISFSIDKSKLDEELGGEEEWQWSARDQQGKLYGTLYVKPMGDTLVVTADDGMPATRYSKEDIIDAMGRGEFLRFRGKNFALDTRMKDWANS